MQKITYKKRKLEFIASYAHIPYSLISSLILGSVFFFFDLLFFKLDLSFESYSFYAFTYYTYSFYIGPLPTYSLIFDGLIPMLVGVMFFEDDLLLSDVLFVPVKVLSFRIFYLDTDLPKDFSNDELFANVVFFISFVFDWVIDDLLPFILSF